jgi:hypothetical protein
MTSTSPKPASPLAARRRRITAIRRRVAATALSTFVLAFGVVSATGSMGAQSATTATAAVASDGSTRATTTATTHDGSGLAAVTTRQS